VPKSSRATGIRAGSGPASACQRRRRAGPSAGGASTRWATPSTSRPPSTGRGRPTGRRLKIKLLHSQTLGWGCCRRLPCGAHLRPGRRRLAVARVARRRRRPSIGLAASGGRHLEMTRASTRLPRRHEARSDRRPSLDRTTRGRRRRHQCTTMLSTAIRVGSAFPGARVRVRQPSRSGHRPSRLSPVTLFRRRNGRRRLRRQRRHSPRPPRASRSRPSATRRQ
jgi:hypothetical protein